MWINSAAVEEGRIISARVLEFLVRDLESAYILILKRSENSAANV